MSHASRALKPPGSLYRESIVFDVEEDKTSSEASFSKDTLELFHYLGSIYTPRDPVAPSEWQERYRSAPAGSPKEGKWRNYCYQVEPLDVANDPTVYSLTLCWASQFLGKSTVIEGITAWRIDQMPSPMVCVFPTSDNAQAWSKNRFGPLIESTPKIAALIDAPQSRKGTRSGYGQNTVVHKKFPGGWILCGGSNSPAQLRMHTAKYTNFDEVDAYDSSSGVEGDPILLTEQRSARYHDSFSIKTSTPTIKHFSRIEKELENSDFRKWFNKCPYCNEDWIIMFSDIKWPKEKQEGKKTIHRIDLAYLECPSCGKHLTDEERMQMVTDAESKGGGWRKTNYAPEVRGKAGFWANAFIVLGKCKRGFNSWMHYFAQRYIDASKLGVEGLKTFQNLVCGESYEAEQAKPPEPQVLYQRREMYPEYNGEIILPEKSLFLVASADCQLDRIEAEIMAYGQYEETWGVEYKIFRGNVDTMEIWNELDQWVQKKFKHPSGHMLSPACVCIDAGNKPNPVYYYSHRCIPRKVFAVRGFRGYVSNWVNRSNNKSRLFILKVDGAKESLYSRLRLVESGPGMQHFPANQAAGYDLVYFEQLCSESMRTAFARGRFEPYFDLTVSGSRNEALDTRIYGMGAKEILNPDYNAILQELLQPALNDWRPSAISEKEKIRMQKEAQDKTDCLVQVPLSTPRKDPVINNRRSSGWSKI